MAAPSKLSGKAMTHHSHHHQQHGQQQLSATRIFEEVSKEEVDLGQDIQELSECCGPASAINGWNELIHDKFKKIEKHLQTVKKLAAEQDKETQKKSLLDQVELHEARCKE